MANELKFLRRSGAFGHRQVSLATTEVLVFDRWEVCALDAGMRVDHLKNIDDRAAGKATIATRLRVGHWHGRISDAGLDLLMQSIYLGGESMRRPSRSAVPAPHSRSPRSPNSGVARLGS